MSQVQAFVQFKRALRMEARGETTGKSCRRAKQILDLLESLPCSLLDSGEIACQCCSCDAIRRVLDVEGAS